MTAMNPLLSVALTLADLCLRFGQVRRVTRHPDGEFESDTTHTVMLTLIVIEVAPLAGCDPGLAAQFAAVHDFPETFALDTNTARELSPEAAAVKAAREASAMRQLGEMLDGSRTMDLLRRYEAQQEPEARLVRYLDKVLPKLTHYLNGGLALRTLGMTVEDMRESHGRQGAKLSAQYPELVTVKDLFEAACALVEAGVADGSIHLARAP